MDHWGATWEDHVAKTEDGFNLTMFRITGFADTGPIEVTKPPLLTSHPMFQNAEFWIDPQYSLRGEDTKVIKLAKAGFDVWLGN